MPSPDGVHGGAAVVPKREVLPLVEAEFEMFKRFCVFVCSTNYRHHGGNPFTVVCHDDVTLHDKAKRTAGSVQMVFEQINFFIAFMFRPVEGNDSASHVHQIDENGPKSPGVS